MGLHFVSKFQAYYLFLNELDAILFSSRDL